MFSDAENAVETQASKSSPGQVKPKPRESDRPLGRLADLAENLGSVPDFGKPEGPAFEEPEGDGN